MPARTQPGSRTARAAEARLSWWAVALPALAFAALLLLRVR